MNKGPEDLRSKPNFRVVDPLRSNAAEREAEIQLFWDLCAPNRLCRFGLTLKNSKHDK